MARRSATGKQEQAKRTRAAAARTSKNKGKQEDASTETAHEEGEQADGKQQKNGALQAGEQQSANSDDAPTAPSDEADTALRIEESQDTEAVATEHGTQRTTTPKKASPRKKTTTAKATPATATKKTPRKPRAKAAKESGMDEQIQVDPSEVPVTPRSRGKPKQSEPNEDDHGSTPGVVPTSRSKGKQKQAPSANPSHDSVDRTATSLPSEPSMQSSMDSEAEVAAAMAAQAIAKASDDDVRKSNEKMEEKTSSLYMISPSTGKATPARQKRRLQSRAASSPYATGSTPVTPKSAVGDQGEGGSSTESRIHAQDTSTRTPMAKHRRAEKSEQSAVQSQPSPAVRALQSIAGLLSPWRSSRARQSAAFGNVDDVRVAKPKQVQEGRKVSDLIEKEEEKQVNQKEARVSQSTADLPSQQFADQEHVYPALPSAPLVVPIEHTVPNSSAEGVTLLADTVSSFEEHGHELQPDEEDEVIAEVSFASLPGSPQNEAEEEGNAADKEAQTSAATEIHLPSVPHSPPHSPQQPLTVPLATDALASRPSTYQGPGFGTSSPFGLPNGFSREPAVQAVPDVRSPSPPYVPTLRTPVDVFTFGSKRDPNSPRVAPLPRSTFSAKSTSPLAKNYELLSRFFAEKAAAETAGEASLLDDEGADDSHALGGLTEVELAGCMRIIEQSFAQGQGEEIRRLRNEALERSLVPRSSPSVSAGSPFARGANEKQHDRISRSPSLPLGAAANESISHFDVGVRSRPSTSFLAPSSLHNAQSLGVERSLAHAFAPNPLPRPQQQRRHRPLYLGPGVGAALLTSDAVRRSQLAQQRRLALQSHRRAQQMALPKHEETRTLEGVAPKRRRLPDTETGQNRAYTSHSTISQVPEPSPLFHKSVDRGSETVESEAKKSKASAISLPPQRSLTANAMLSILRSTPLQSPHNAVKEKAAPALVRTINPELVNPYEGDQRRIAKRPSVAPSSALVAKEKERLREERERRQRDMLERKTSRKESALELIERTAPAIRRGGRRIRVEPEDEEDDAPGGTESPAAPTVEAKKDSQDSALLERQRKTQEVQKRLESLQASKANADRNQPHAKANHPPATTDKVTGAVSDAAQPAASTAAKIASIPSLASFAPKKPSPLSQSANNVPGSPSTASEVSERDAATAASSATASPAKSTPAPPFAFSIPKDTPKQTVTSESLSTPVPQMGPNKAVLANTPLFSFNAAEQKSDEISKSGQTDSLPPANAIAPSPQDKVRALPKGTLPLFDFELAVIESAKESALEGECDKRQALEIREGSLPQYDFGQSGQDLSGETAAKAASSSSLSSRSTPAAAISGSGFSFKPFSPVPPTTNGSHDGVAGIEADAKEGAAEGDGASAKSASALLSGAGEGEEDEDTLHEVRCKIWSLESGKWNDLGVGALKLKKHQTNGKKRVLVRNEGNGKVTVNFRVLPSLKPNLDKNIVSFLGFTTEGKPMNFRCKVKTEDGARSLKEAMEREAGTA